MLILRTMGARGVSGFYAVEGCANSWQYVKLQMPVKTVVWTAHQEVGMAVVTAGHRDDRGDGRRDCRRDGRRDDR